MSAYGPVSDEFRRVIRSNRIYQAMMRTLRRSPDVTDKSTAFRRDVLNAIAADHYQRTEFAAVPAFRDRTALLRATLAHVNGDWTTWIELGVGSGASTTLIRSVARDLGIDPMLHGFDSFEGLPEAWGDIAPAGTYRYAPPRLDDDRIKLHKGWFADTVPAFAARCSGPIGFVHVDCDLYSSTSTALTALADWLPPGSVLLFDEYWNYLEAPEHEQRALAQFVARQGLCYRYLGYNSEDMQASIVLTEGRSTTGEGEANPDGR